jgi:hypothetical protein
MSAVGQPEEILVSEKNPSADSISFQYSIKLYDYTALNSV